MSTKIEIKPLHEISLSWSAYRLINPRVEAQMKRSLEMYGQISPVVCVETAGGLELLDGFKRFRACNDLSWDQINLTIMATNGRGSKAAMIGLNRIARTITDFEEAMLLHSLHRDDLLSQVEISTLLGRDKSWVCRRIALIERLHEEVKENLRLGLISVSIGRELVKLPRGNQPAVLAKILEHRLGKRDVEKLVRLLLSRSQSDCGQILLNLQQHLDPAIPSVISSHQVFYNRLAKLEHLQKSILGTASHGYPPENARELNRLNSVISLGGKLVGYLSNLANDTCPEEDQ